MITPPAITSSRLMELLSDRVGLIRTLVPVTRGLEEPTPPWIYQATLSNFDFRKPDKAERISVGKGRTREEAAAGAIGEAVERYCAAHLAPDKIRRATCAAAGSNAIAPPEFVLYSERQYAQKTFPHHQWRPDDEISWLEARELPGETPVTVPAGLVFLASQWDRVEDMLCPATSNGLAAGPDRETAALNGLCEIIERDGFLIHWMNRLPAPELDFEADHGLAGTLRAHYRRFGVEVRVFNISTDLPAYVMMAIALEGEGRAPAALVGLGCHLDPEVALIKALFEICQIRPGLTERCRADPPEGRLKNYSDVRTLEDHSAFLGIPARRVEFDFLLRNGRKQRLGELPNRATGRVAEDLRQCAGAVAAAGYRVGCAELTTPDVADYNLRVVRILVTGLQPMHFGHGEERLGGRRLFEAPQTLGYATQARTEQELNPCPHPLA